MLLTFKLIEKYNNARPISENIPNKVVIQMNNVHMQNKATIECTIDIE